MHRPALSYTGPYDHDIWEVAQVFFLPVCATEVELCVTSHEGYPELPADDSTLESMPFSANQQWEYIGS